MLGQTYAAMGESGRADACFREAADVFREAEDSAHLADVLYAHALSLRNAGEIEAALALWREEEALRREIRDDVGLGDCLFQQLLATNERAHDPNANLRFAEAGDAYRRGGAPERAADVRHTHARWLRAREMDDQALVRVREALDLLAGVAEPVIECQVRGLHAMMLADAGDFAAAAAELDAAEAAGTLAEDEALVVGVLARRAYLRAREGATPADVVAELEALVEHARAGGNAGVGTYAAGEISEEITARCGSEYREPLAAFRRGLREES
jgi:tetratricopeptide (TPR) repeat protein